MNIQSAHFARNFPYGCPCGCSTVHVPLYGCSNSSLASVHKSLFPCAYKRQNVHVATLELYFHNTARPGVEELDSAKLVGRES